MTSLGDYVDVLDPMYAYEADWVGVATVYPMPDVLPYLVCPMCRQGHSGLIAFSHGRLGYGNNQMVLDDCACEIDATRYVLVRNPNYTDDVPPGVLPEGLEWHRRRDIP